MTKDVISLSISVLLLFRHYISHKISFGAPSSGGVLCSACGAFIGFVSMNTLTLNFSLEFIAYTNKQYLSLSCNKWATLGESVIFVFVCTKGPDQYVCSLLMVCVCCLESIITKLATCIITVSTLIFSFMAQFHKNS